MDLPSTFMVAKPDKHTGTASKADGPHKGLGSMSSGYRHRQENSVSIEMQRVGAILGWVKFPRRSFYLEVIWI